ncbi:MAG: stage II sporulation protein M [Nitriliruptoraceae bacterium]|nr:stage II sporulation protein M [Nitriliruptoraceae bacterium]
MEVDGYIRRNEPTWQRLDALTRAARSGPASLPPGELDELVRLHLRVSAQLSTVRTHLRDPELAAYLSGLVGRSNAIVHGTRARSFTAVWYAITRVFPAAVWHDRKPILVATAVFLLAAFSVGTWLAVSPTAVEAVLPAEDRERYIEEEFEAYYSSEPGTTFFARVFANNARVGLLAFGAGVLWGLPTLGILAVNGANVGVAGGLFHAADDAARFWTLILPHGLLELTAVFIAGGAGLRIGWALIAPGDRPRAEALSDAARRSVTIALGLVLVFLAAGLIEGYVTGQPWSAWVRVGIGAGVWAAFLAWVVVAGRAAAARGWTGAIGERMVDDVAPTATPGQHDVVPAPAR